MKNIFFITIITIFSLLACKEDLMKPTYLVYDTNGQNYTLVVYKTKEPFIEIKDRGVEAYLVLYDFDKDNQVNGKISQEDANIVSRLNLSNSKDDQLFLKFQAIKELFKIETSMADDFIVKDLSDLKSFKILSSLNIHSFIGRTLSLPPQSNVLQLTLPSDITMDLENCGNVQTLYIPASTLNNPTKEIEIDFEELDGLKNFTSIGGSFKKIGSKNNPRLTYIHIDSNRYDGEIDLSDIENLSFMEISNSPNIKSIKLSESLNARDIMFKNNSKLERINFFKNSIIGAIYLQDNTNLKNLDISETSKISYCRSVQNKTLKTIFINKNQKIDSIFTNPYNAPWQKDPWTNWVVKK